jgi:hypothetical protein
MLVFGIITSLHGMSPLTTYGLGIGFSIAAFAVGFVPPAGLPETSALSHTVVLVVAVAFGVLAPLGISRWSHRHPGA